MYTIELNLDDDFASSCAYHIDDERTTIRTNLSHALESKKTQRWVFIGSATTLEEANEKCKKLRKLLCEMSNKEEKNLPIS
jgi:hypothetical protein